MNDLHRIVMKEVPDYGSDKITSTNRPRGKAGRPSKTDPRSEKESCRLSEKEAATFRRVCKERGLRPADYLRECCLAAAYLPKSVDTASKLADAFLYLRELENNAARSGNTGMVASLGRLRKKFASALLGSAVIAAAFMCEANANARMTLQLAVERLAQFMISHSLMIAPLVFFFGLWIWPLALKAIRPDKEMDEAFRQEIRACAESPDEEAILLRRYRIVDYICEVWKWLLISALAIYLIGPLVFALYELANWDAAAQALIAHSNGEPLKQAAYAFGSATISLGMLASIVFVSLKNKIRAMREARRIKPNNAKG